jgi:RNA polymerase primary sigma factor
MPIYRLDSMADLARQLGFTPAEPRQMQITAAERLLHELDANKAYPFDFVVYRITGYQPKLPTESNLLTGSALQHDLGLLIEQVSDTLDLHAAANAEPVLSIDDVTEKFNVTSKTIQRWRRRGLPARRFVFPDGKRRVGFLLGSVERFLLAHQDQTCRSTNLTQVNETECQAIVRHARRLAMQGGCGVAEITRRIGKKLHRSPLTILHTLRKHDEQHPQNAVLSLACADVDDDRRARILRGHKRGLPIKKLARRLGCPRSAIYRVIVDERVARLNKRKIKFIDDPLYHEADAAAAITTILSPSELEPPMKPEDSRVPRDLPPYLRELYRVPLLSAARERALFLAFNFHKCRFVTARRKLEPQFARSRQLDTLEAFLHEATATKNEILRANLRLVVSVARKHVRPGLSLMELISEGNITLMRAVEGFDIHKGYRFSTYATLALMKGFARSVPLMLAGQKSLGDAEALAAIPDARLDQTTQHRLDRDHVQQMLATLDDRERHVLLAHYGLDHEQSSPATYEQVAHRLGLTRQHVRQIEQNAIAKLRQNAHS